VLGGGQLLVSQGTVNQPWINGVLATNRLPHIFTMGHVSAFQVTTDHRSMSEYAPAALRDLFWNSLSNTGAKVYLCGHYHFYDHARMDDGDGNPENDLHQLVLGAGGAPPMTKAPNYPGTNSTWTPIPIFHDVDYAYGLVNVDGPNVTVTVKHRIGPNNFQANGDVFAYASPRAPVLKVARNGGTSLRFDLSQLRPGYTNVLEEQAILSAGTWQAVTQFVSASSTTSVTLPLSTSANSGFFRARSW
jgi:hypothetical protein